MASTGLLTVADFCELSGLHSTTVQSYARYGKIVAQRKGRKGWLFDKEDVLRFINERQPAKTDIGNAAKTLSTSDYYNIGYVCRTLKMLPATAINSAESGLIPAKKFGSEWYFEKSIIDKLVNEKEKHIFKNDSRAKNNKYEEVRERNERAIISDIKDTLAKGTALCGSICNLVSKNLRKTGPQIRMALKRYEDVHWTAYYVELGNGSSEKYYKLINDKFILDRSKNISIGLAISKPIEMVPAVMPPEVPKIRYPQLSDEKCIAFITDYLKEAGKPVWRKTIMEAGCAYFNCSETFIETRLVKNTGKYWTSGVSQKGFKEYVLINPAVSINPVTNKPIEKLQTINPILDNANIKLIMREPEPVVIGHVPAEIINLNGKEYVDKESYEDAIEENKLLMEKLKEQPALQKINTTVPLKLRIKKSACGLNGLNYSELTLDNFSEFNDLNPGDMLQIVLPNQ
jgi:Helix-turn-helix domain